MLYMEEMQDINVSFEHLGGASPLLLACKHGAVDVAKVLLGRGANINQRDSQERTAIFWAASVGQSECLRLLLDWCEDLDLEGGNHLSPLNCAAYNDHFDCLCMLLEKGAIVDTQNTMGWTPLHYAALYNDTSTLDVLATHMADPYIQNIQGETALDVAVRERRSDSVSFLNKYMKK